MTQIGSIVIKNRSELTEKRTRIADLTAGLGFSEIYATRVATIISEIVTRTLKKDRFILLNAFLKKEDKNRFIIYEITAKTIDVADLKDSILSVFNKTEEMMKKDGQQVFRGYCALPEFINPPSKKNLDFLGNEFTKLTKEEALEAAESSHRKIKTVFDSAVQILIITTDIEGIITLINSGTRNLLGYTEKNLVGQSFTDKIIVHEEVKERSKQFLKETGLFVKGFALFAERIQRYGQDEWECSYRKKDGSTIIVNQVGTAIRNEDGELTGYLFVSQDISAKKEAEKEILRLASVVKQAKNTIVITDLNGNIVYANPFFEVTSGYTVEEALGKNPRVLKSGVQDEKFYEELWGTITKGKTWNGVFVNKRKDGALYHEEATIFPILDSAGDIINYAAVKQDVTQRILAENELKESEAKLRSITSSAQDAIIMMNDEGKITFWNPAAEKIFGYSVEEALNKKVHEFIAPSEYRGQFYKNFKNFKKTGRGNAIGKIVELEGLRKNGEKFPVALSLSAVQIKGRWHSVGIVRDITDQKNAEKALKANMEALKESNEEIKRFAYIVSHDLRAPLVNLKGFSGELRRGMEILNPVIKSVIQSLDKDTAQDVRYAFEEDIPEALGFIETSVDKMDRFISSILTLSRIGRRELKWQTVDVKQIVDEIVRTLSHQIGGKGITIKSDNLPVIKADRTSIEQIFGNLLDNAVKFMDRKTDGIIEIGYKEDNKFYTFFVKDNGRGISEKDIEKVFALFRRAGKQDKPGEGMGMAYVQTLVKRHGGRIWVESEMGKGTVFYFTISKEPENTSRN